MILSEGSREEQFYCFYQFVEVAHILYPVGSSSVFKVSQNGVGSFSHSLTCLLLPSCTYKGPYITQDPPRYPRITGQLNNSLNSSHNLNSSLQSTTYSQGMDPFGGRGHFSVSYNVQSSLGLCTILFFHTDTQTYTKPTHTKFFGFPCSHL